MSRCSPRAAWAAAAALLLALPLAAGWSAPAQLLQSVYAEKLEAPEYFTVTGFVALERFAPVPRSQLEVVLTVGGVQRRTARVLPNAAWTFHGVPPGTHALDVVAPGAPPPASRLLRLPARARRINPRDSSVCGPGGRLRGSVARRLWPVGQSLARSAGPSAPIPSDPLSSAQATR